MNNLALVTLCVLVFGTAQATNAQSLSDLLSQPSPAHADATGPAWAYNSWLAAPSDDEVFAPVDRIIATSGLRQSDIDRLATKGAAPSADELDAAKYEYALFSAMHTGTANYPLETIDTYVSTISYQPQHVSEAYARATFLCFSVTSMSQPWVRSLGMRLLAQNPHDYWVIHGMCLLARPWEGPGEKQQALAWAATLQKLEPNRPSTYWAEEYIREECAMANPNIPDLDAQIWALHKIIPIEKFAVGMFWAKRLLAVATDSRIELSELQSSGISAPMTVCADSSTKIARYTAYCFPKMPKGTYLCSPPSETWHWSANCSPQTGSGTVTVECSIAGRKTNTSTVTCDVTWRTFKTGPTLADYKFVGTRTVHCTGKTTCVLSQPSPVAVKKPRN